MSFANDDYYKELIHAFLSNQISEEKVKELQIWISQSDDNKKQFIEFRRVWMLTSQGALKGKFNKAKYNEWQKLSEKLTPTGEKSSRILLSPLQKIIRIAAVFLLIVSVGATIAWRISSQKLQTFVSMETVTRINTPLGGRSEVVLPDGSKVKLNAGSTISYSRNYGYTGRNIILEGEGYFEVETNPRMPFVVEASDLKIKAFGTIFNVKAYPEEEKITTTLVEGIVKIEGENFGYTLKPNQKITYIKSGHRHILPESENQIRPEEDISPSEKKVERTEPPRILLANNVNILHETGWKDGCFIFSSEKLSNLAVILERKFNVSIEILSSELKDHRFTGAFHQETLEQILGIINLSAPINYQIEKGVVSIQLDTKRRAIFKEISYN